VGFYCYALSLSFTPLFLFGLLLSYEKSLRIGKCRSNHPDMRSFSAEFLPQPHPKGLQGPRKSSYVTFFPNRTFSLLVYFCLWSPCSLFFGLGQPTGFVFTFRCLSFFRFTNFFGVMYIHQFPSLFCLSYFPLAFFAHRGPSTYFFSMYNKNFFAPTEEVSFHHIWNQSLFSPLFFRPPHICTPFSPMCCLPVDPFFLTLG